MRSPLLHQHRPADGRADGLIVMIHGRGSDEFDLLPLIDTLDPAARLIGLAPRGPHALSQEGAHWYAVEEIGHPDSKTFMQAYRSACVWLDRTVSSLQTPWERVVIGGFSQGAVMSYALAFGAGRPTPAGVICLSGFIPSVDGLELELDGRRGTGVIVCHGVNDSRIPAGFGRSAAVKLRQHDIPVDYTESAYDHSVDPLWIPPLREWLERRLPPVEDRE